MEGHGCIHKCATTIMITVMVAMQFKKNSFEHFETVRPLHYTYRAFPDQQDDTLRLSKIMPGIFRFLTVANRDQKNQHSVTEALTRLMIQHALMTLFTKNKTIHWRCGKQYDDQSKTTHKHVIVMNFST